MNNRILGIIGASLLIFGIFMPIVSVFGLLNFSYFNLIQIAPGTFFTGIFLLLLGIGSLVLALKNQFKPLIATAVVSLALLAFDFYRVKSGLSEASSAAGTGSMGGGELKMDLGNAVSVGMAFYIMAVGAILLIVSGVMKTTVPAPSAGGWPQQPPPPPSPPYFPGQ
jgi:hypothetical protein